VFSLATNGPQIGRYTRKLNSLRMKSLLEPMAPSEISVEAVAKMPLVGNKRLLRVSQLNAKRTALVRPLLNRLRSGKNANSR
jgi:hypothetical protein